MEAILLIFGAVAGTAVFLAVAYLLYGWALHLLWLWFVVPIFGLPVISIGQAIGISMIVSFLTEQYIPKPKETKNTVGADVIGFFLKPVVTVLIALLIKQFI